MSVSVFFLMLPIQISGMVNVSNSIVHWNVVVKLVAGIITIPLIGNSEKKKSIKKKPSGKRTERSRQRSLFNRKSLLSGFNEYLLFLKRFVKRLQIDQLILSGRYYVKDPAITGFVFCAVNLVAILTKNVCQFDLFPDFYYRMNNFKLSLKISFVLIKIIFDFCRLVFDVFFKINHLPKSGGLCNDY